MRHPATIHGIYSIQDLERHYERKTGGHWFKPETMRFFRSRLSGELFYSGSLVFFVSSEQGPDGIRAWSVRCYNTETGSIDTAGDFQQHSTLARAKRAARNAAKGSEVKS